MKWVILWTGWDMTRLINIAIPKSGSGMLAQAIGGEHANIGPGMYEDHPDLGTLEEMRFTEPFARSHQPYHSEYEQLYRERGDKVVFLHRDPRDVIVSHAMYVDKWAGHRSYFNFPIGEDEFLATAEDRILELIEKSLWLYDRYLGWMDADFVLPLKYEELVNSDGSKNPKGFQKFIDYLGKYAKDLKISSPKGMIKKIDPQSCNTYRKGIIGDWKNHFTEEHKELFWETCGNLMEKLGYI